jgi:O-antigen/teichoic acid export membrane protein
MGAYFFAFVYARQVVNEIQGRLIRVLFPALTKMSDQPQRQLRAFISAARLVMIVILPLTLLQVALAGPIVRLIYPDGKWDAAIPLMQLLSFAMAVRGLAGPSESLLQAQGRFKAHMNTHWLFAGLLTIAVLVAVNIDSALSTPVRVALALIVVYAFMTQVRLQVALSPWGLSLTSSLRIWLPVFSIGVVSFGAVWWSTIQVKASDLQSIFIVPAVGLTIYLGFVRAFLPSSFQDVLNRIKSVLVRDQ